MAVLNAVNAPFAVTYDTEYFIPTAETNDTVSSPIATPTLFREDQGNYIDDAFGSGFTYGAPENGLVWPISGTLTGLKIYTKVDNSPGSVVLEYSNANIAVSALEGAETNEILFTGNDTITTGQFADKLAGYGGNDTIDGGGGLDTADYFGSRSAYSIEKIQSNWQVSGGNDGTDTLINIERLHFSDNTRVALDVTDNALETLQFIGVIAPSLQSNLNVRGTILSLFDQGKSMQEMSQLALDLGLITSDNTALAKQVFKNVFNTTADPDQNLTNTLVNFIEQNGDAKFLATVAGLNINVDLVGLQQHGMEFI